MRKYIDINKKWLFSTEISDENKAFDDTLINLPFLHNIETMPQCTFSAKWIAGEEDDGKTVYLQLKQLTADADVYLGDKFIGSHSSSDNNFTMLLTLEAHMGEVFDVILRLTPHARPDGFFVFAGANLITADSSHFDMLQPGKALNITTAIENSSAVISINAGIVRPNNYDVVSYTVTDMKGDVVFSKTCKPTEPDTSFTLELPELWEGQSGAYLYKLRASLLRDSQCLDSLEEAFGIREFSLNPDGFFYLNGFRLPLDGIELTDCSSVKNDLKNFRTLDANTLISSYLPTKTDILSFCDTAGIFFWYSLPFTSDREKDMACLKEFLLSERIHPSLTGVVCSEKADEAYFTEFCKICQETAPFVLPVLKRSIETAASTIPDNAKAIMLILPFKTDSEAFMGINVRFSELTEKYPDRFFAVSPTSPKKDEVSLKEFNDWHIRMWNTFCRQKGVFAYFSGILTDSKAPSSKRGLTSTDRLRLYDIFWFYKAQFSSEGFIKICSTDDIPTDAKSADIKCITNCPNLRILVNGKDKKYKADRLCDGLYVFRELKLKKDINLIEVSAGDECDYTELLREK